VISFHFTDWFALTLQKPHQTVNAGKKTPQNKTRKPNTKKASDVSLPEQSVGFSSGTTESFPDFKGKGRQGMGE